MRIAKVSRHSLESWAKVVTIIFFTTITSGALAQSIVGIDHISLAVRDLERASVDFRQLGFALKPGRLHDDTIRNNHIKFVDGSGIEIITASAPKDPLAARYVELLSGGEGPASLAFHARSTAQLLRTLREEHIGYVHKAGLTTLQDPDLQFLFFVQDNRSDSDRPEHFAHPNGARAMSQVWLAPDDPSKVVHLLVALGARQRHCRVFVPEPVDAMVFEVENGQIVMLPRSHQVIRGRAVVGAAFEVTRFADSFDREPPKDASSPASPAAVRPDAAHGMWLTFRLAH